MKPEQSHLTTCIERHGFVNISQCCGDAKFYTVGFTESNLPELVVTVPVRQDLMHRIITDIFHHWKENGFNSGVSNDFLVNMPLEFVRVDVETFMDEILELHSFYRNGKHLSVVQVVLPDENGLLPSQQGYDMPQKLFAPITLN
ncbi:hypothetical protein VCR15J2_390058 [Vibrio coralliirubri]|uniref:DUF4262 domain-containing protein n=1 Tax=Vibrio coralliirubri TaxID=1516159 RepID=UPI00062F0FAC|nr:DUF4262 domain-containing protein [Vibrio coralliirubri]CDT53326.1 hypothetical protein VCR15J2_390058 [Vibrio coralliirubri]